MRKLLFLAALLFSHQAWAANCTNSTITATGAGSCTVPAAMTSATFKVFGSGGSGSGGSDPTFTYAGAAGAGACVITLTVTPGNTVFYSNAAGGAADTGVGHDGATSWVNITSNAQPASSANGCYATGGGSGVHNTTQGIGGLGNSNQTGGTGGFDPTLTFGGGGGGGAGSGGGGGLAAVQTGGAGGTPDGGSGSNGVSAGSASAGTQPGGGGGGSTGTSSGKGGNGEIMMAFSAPAPASGTFFLPAATVP